MGQRSRRRTPLRSDVAEPRSCSLDTRRRILHQLPFFQALSPAEIERVGDLFWERGFRLGDVIHRQGEPASHLYVLAIGKVRIDRRLEGGPSVLLDIIGPGDYFGTLPALGGPVYADSATALTAGCALVIDASDFDAILERHPSAARAALQVTSTRLEEARADIVRRSTLTLEQRVADALLRLAERFGEMRADETLIQVPLGREDLAAMTDATIESVSRVMSRFRELGLIRSGRRWIALRDPERLVAIAGRSAG